MNSPQRLILCMCLLAGGIPAAWAAPPPSEYQVKAAYLFNFGQFVEWPSGAYASAAAPLDICIVGDDPFGNVIDELVRGESVDGHPLQVRRLKADQEIKDCNIVFVGRSQGANLAPLLAVLRGHDVLTVSDSPGAEHQGAVITLYTENNRVHMRINLETARANHLVISSKLLRPAEVIGQEGP